MTNSGLSSGAYGDVLPSANESVNPQPELTSGTAPTANPFATPEDLQLGEVLAAQKIHPVILFGGQTTGKTVLLFSLLAYGFENSNARMRVTLGTPVHDTSTDNGQNSANMAQSLFDYHLERWRESIGNERTSGGAFFVPVDVTVSLDDGTELSQKFAFLDWTGENFLRNNTRPESPGGISRGQRSPIMKPIEAVGRSVLSHFSKNISVLFLAPVFNLSNAKDEEDAAKIIRNQKETAKRLLIGVEQYEAHRASRARLDNLIFLINKWDCLHPPGSPGFKAPSESMLEDELNRRYSDAWTQFKTIRGVTDQQRSKMQYSSGEHDGEDRRMKYDDDIAAKEQVARYARTLWNWLFINTCGQPAFADVMPPPRPPQPPAPPPPPPPRPPSMVEVGMRWLNRL